MKLLDLNALAAQSCLSKSTLRKYAKSMGMPHYRVSRKILVDPEEFRRWLREFQSASGQNHADLDQMLDRAVLKYK